MQKQKKLLTETSKQATRGLRIAESPKRIAKLKLGLLLQTNKQEELQQINEVVHKKLQDRPSPPDNNARIPRQHNTYETTYLTDMAIWKEYCESTERYEHSGISLKWPYYFSTVGNKHKERVE